MNTSNPTTGNVPKKNWLFPVGIGIIALGSLVVVSCFHDDDPQVNLTQDDTFLPQEPAPIDVQGTALFCDEVAPTSTDAEGLFVAEPDSIAKHNVSFDPTNTGDATNPASWNNHNSGNNVKRMSAIVLSQKPDGTAVLDPDSGVQYDVHPLVVSYGEQVIGAFEGGDGSADIGDPDNVDDIFVSLSLDNGISWKKIKVGDTAKNMSSIVTWNGLRIPYPGHSHKPTMAVQGISSCSPGTTSIAPPAILSTLLMTRVTSPVIKRTLTRSTVPRVQSTTVV